METFPDTVIKKAQHLPGIDELAWPMMLAKEVISSLKDKPVVILGGDIYEKQKEQWRNVTPNWFTEMKPGETWESYANRSQIESLTFLESTYRDTNVLFTLVIQTKPDAQQIANSVAYQ